MAKNLTPNPFPSGKGNRNEEVPFSGWGPEGAARKIAWAPRIVAVGAVAIYRAAVSPVIHAINGPACRFEPSCSVYARDAIAEYGIVRGGAMAIWRVARCNPIGGHGFDPVRGRGVER
jgi:putative membrane protein insertion efficiency factor